jgi:hypothetical protein
LYQVFEFEGTDFFKEDEPRVIHYSLAVLVSRLMRTQMAVYRR